MRSRLDASRELWPRSGRPASRDAPVARLGRSATGFWRWMPAPLTEAERASRDRKALAPARLCNVKSVQIGPARSGVWPGLRIGS